jgi:hypothetical protein
MSITGVPSTTSTPREGDARPGDLDELNEAQADRIDPARPPGREDPYPAALHAEQEWPLPERRDVTGRLLMQPGQQPCVVKAPEPV